MSLILIFLIFALSYLALKFHKKKVAKGLQCTGAVLFILIAIGVIPRLALNLIQVYPHLEQPEWKQKNMIVALSAGINVWRNSTYAQTSLTGYPRLVEATRLYLNCKQRAPSCTLLLTGGDPSDNGISEAQVAANELLTLNIPVADLMVEGNSNDTYQNARNSAALIKSFSPDKLILVTSHTHIMRSLFFFRLFGVYAEAAPSESLSPRLSPLSVSYNFFILDNVLYEGGAYIKYLLKYKYGKSAS